MGMYIFLTVLIIIVCVLLMVVVLVQNPKGGGLGAGFGGSASNIMGVQKTGDVLEKATWYLVIALMVLSLSSAIFIERGEIDQSAKSSGVTEEVSAPVNLPPTPTPNK